eukprot:TRINITY_DN118_c5_g1_i1.p1 TRINITY_DN118_c5_g1~~TRINITY_DN118_c5_g1_i1.p1  ORF type:complete len:1641 (+),score=478.48 TRINITY_DN118_c5_g1_i1:3715-8637(+)
MQRPPASPGTAMCWPCWVCRRTACRSWNRCWPWSRRWIRRACVNAGCRTMKQPMRPRCWCACRMAAPYWTAAGPCPGGVTVALAQPASGRWSRLTEASAHQNTRPSCRYRFHTPCWPRATPKQSGPTGLVPPRNRLRLFLQGPSPKASRLCHTLPASRLAPSTGLRRPGRASSARSRSQLRRPYSRQLPKNWSGAQADKCWNPPRVKPRPALLADRLLAPSRATLMVLLSRLKAHRVLACMSEKRRSSLPKPRLASAERQQPLRGKSASSSWSMVRRRRATGWLLWQDWNCAPLSGGRLQEGAYFTCWQLIPMRNSPRRESDTPRSSPAMAESMRYSLTGEAFTSLPSRQTSTQRRLICRQGARQLPLLPQIGWRSSLSRLAPLAPSSRSLRHSRPLSLIQGQRWPICRLMPPWPLKLFDSPRPNSRYCGPQDFSSASITRTLLPSSRRTSSCVTALKSPRVASWASCWLICWPSQRSPSRTASRLRTQLAGIWLPLWISMASMRVPLASAWSPRWRAARQACHCCGGSDSCSRRACWAWAASQPALMPSLPRAKSVKDMPSMCGSMSTSPRPSKAFCAFTFCWIRIPTICCATAVGDCSCAASCSGVAMLTAITTSAPMSRAVCTGRLLTRPPSTRVRAPMTNGANSPGTAMLARMARGREPWSSTTSLPWLKSVATARKGMGRRAKSILAGSCAVQFCSSVSRLLPWTRPEASLSLPSSRPAASEIGYCNSSSRCDCGSRARSLRSKAMSERLVAARRCSSASAPIPLAQSPPISAPMLVPAMQSMGMCNCSRYCSTPRWAQPRAPPPESTRQMRGRLAGAAWMGTSPLAWAGLASASRPRAASKGGMVHRHLRHRRISRRGRISARTDAPTASLAAGEDGRRGARQGAWIVLAEMQAAAFLAGQGAGHDQLGHIDQVAQLQQVTRDAEVGVVLVDLLLEQADAVLGALQTLVGAHDADVVPHEAAQFIPVVGDHHFLVGIGDAALVPQRHLGQAPGAGGQIALDIFRRRAAQYQAFQQRIAGQAVGAMQAGIGGLSHRIQAREVGAAGHVGDHATTGVMRRRHHRDGLAGDVDTELQAARLDGREVLGDEGRTLVADIQVHMIQAALLHLEVDGARHDVARRQLGPIVMLGHEALAGGAARRGRQLEQGAFAAQGFADQEGLGIGVVQAGRMELDEFHVCHAAAGTPGHGDTVAGGRIGVGGVQVDLAGAAGGQHGTRRRNGQHAAAAGVLHMDPLAARLGLGVLLAGMDQVDGAVMFQQGDIGVGAHALFQRDLHRMAGGIGGVDDAALAVAALAGEVIAQLGSVVTGEGHALGNEPFDGLAPVLDDVAGRCFIAQAGAGHQGVIDVLGMAVARIQHRGDAALGPVAGPIQQFALGDDHDLILLGKMESYGETGQAAADDGDIALHDREQSCCCGVRRRLQPVGRSILFISFPDRLLPQGKATRQDGPRFASGPVRDGLRHAQAYSGMTGLTLAAACLARMRAVSTLSALARATPMRRRAKDSGLPNRRISAPGMRRASATPSKAMARASCWPQMTAEAPGVFRAVLTGKPRMALACSSNSLCTWLTMVTMPVSCGRGLTSENQTMSPLTNSSTPNRPRPPRFSVTLRAMSRAFSRAAPGIGCGCQDSTQSPLTCT